MSQHQAHGCSTERTSVFCGGAALSSIERVLRLGEACQTRMREASERHKSDHETP